MTIEIKFGFKVYIQSGGWCISSVNYLPSFRVCGSSNSDLNVVEELLRTYITCRTRTFRDISVLLLKMTRILGGNGQISGEWNFILYSQHREPWPWAKKMGMLNTVNQTQEGNICRW